MNQNSQDQNLDSDEDKQEIPSSRSDGFQQDLPVPMYAEQENDHSFQPAYGDDDPEYTGADVTKSNLNITAISNQNFVSGRKINPPIFDQHKENLLGTQKLSLKPQKSNEQPQAIIDAENEYMTRNMVELKDSIEKYDESRFEQVLGRDMYDSEEVLMYLFASVACFNSEGTFDILIKRNNLFKVNKEWNDLFSSPKIFYQLSSFQNSVERRKLDQIALRIALDREFFFMIDCILDRSVMTKEIVQILLTENQKKLLVQQISKPKRPQYLDIDQYSHNNKRSQFTEDLERDLHFNDLVYASLDKGDSSSSIIDLIKIMKNEVNANKFDEVEREFNLKELFRIFVIRRKVKLIRFLFSLQNEFDFSPQLFIESLELEAYDIGALLYKEFFRRLKDSKKENEYIITIIISSFNKNNGQIDFKAFLIRSYMEQFALRHAKQFLNTLDSKISQENKFNILVMNLNIVKAASLLIEILEIMATRFEQLRVRCVTLRQKIETNTKKYMSAVDSELEMRYLLLEKDFEYRDALEIITRYKIIAFLESQFADNVVKEIWRSPYATNNSLFSASTNHRLTFNYFNCINDEEQVQRFYNWKNFRAFEAHPMQFTVWRYSGKSRIIVEFVTNVGLSIAIHILINYVLSYEQNLSSAMTLYLQEKSTLNNIADKTSDQYQRTQIFVESLRSAALPFAQEFFDRVLVVSYVSFLPLMYGFQHIFNIIYASLNKRQVNPYSFLNLLDFVIFAVFFTNILVTYARNLTGTWTDYPLIDQDTRAMIYCTNYYQNNISEDAIWIISIVIMWLRVFYFLRYNEFMGKFIGVIEKLLYEVALFFCLYILNLTFFALIAEICFHRLTDYASLGMAFKTLFYASLGQFDFTELEQCDFGTYFGISYLVIFLCFQIGLVISLFVAVIVVLYDKFSVDRNIYQMLETLEIRSYTQAEKDFSSLVSFPPPLNVFQILFAPFLFTSRNPETVNVVFLCIAYAPVMLGVTLLFLIYNLFLLPVAYVKLFFHKLVMIYVYSKSYRVSRADKFITFCFFAFLGPFTLILNMITDIYFFLRHLWLTDMNKTQHKTSDQKISKETLILLNDFFRQRQEKFLPYKQVASDLRDKMEIIDFVASIIRPRALIDYVHQGTFDAQQVAPKQQEAPKIPDQKHMTTMFTKIKEFATIKRLMERNCEYIRFENSQRIKTVDCKVLYIAVADMLRHKTVLKVEDENYVFIRRAIGVRQMKAQQQVKKPPAESSAMAGSGSAQSEGQFLPSVGDSAGNEGLSKEQRKRQTQLFKKLLFLNTKRMLEILGYKTGDSETKKLLHAMKLDRQQNLMPGRVGPGRVNMNDFEDMEDKVLEIGQINPKLNISLSQIRHEVQTLVQTLQVLQIPQLKTSEKERAYKVKMNELIQDLDKMKEENANLKNNQIILSPFQPVEKKSQSPYNQDEEEGLIQKEPSEKAFNAIKQSKLTQQQPNKEKPMDSQSDVPDIDDDDDE